VAEAGAPDPFTQEQEGSTLITFSRARRALAVAVTAAAALPATASAVSVTVTGDDGNPIPLSGDVTIRTMDAKVAIARSGGEDIRFSATFVGPDGANAASPVSCARSATPRSMEYRGNGAYTIQVTTYNEPDSSCQLPPLDGPSTSKYTVNAGVGLAAPAGRVLIRAPKSVLIQPVGLPVVQNPGATRHEVRYAARGVIGSDGAIIGPSAQAFVSRTTSMVGLRLTAPGRYTVVGRAQRGEFFSPWSAPVVVDAVAPFEIRSARTPDARGPSYRIAVNVRERSAAGSRVRLAYARGTKGGRYRSLGSVWIDSKGVVTKRFTIRRRGTYRMRYTYPGSATVAPGVVVQQFRVGGRLSFG
jgi:hypothetical protein